jgi:hypothetical protein
MWQRNSKKIGRNLAKLSRKMGILLQNNPLNFIFRILAKCRNKKNAALTHRNEPAKEIEK